MRMGGGLMVRIKGAACDLPNPEVVDECLQCEKRPIQERSGKVGYNTNIFSSDYIYVMKSG